MNVITAAAVSNFINDGIFTVLPLEYIREEFIRHNAELVDKAVKAAKKELQGKHTEESFKRVLKICLRNFSNRSKWKYIGVWERSPQKQRLHFHGIFYIPAGTMPGMILDISDYNFKSQRRRITHQNTYFNERFGRSDFEEIEGRSVGGVVAYIMKYIEKSGGKLLYSRGLPQFFISDIMEEDVVCPYGEEEQKLLLYDDFSCWDEGEYMGQVCDEVIGRLPKAN